MIYLLVLVRAMDEEARLELERAVAAAVLAAVIEVVSTAADFGEKQLAGRALLEPAPERLRCRADFICRAVFDSCHRLNA